MTMTRAFSLIYGIVCYAVFFATFLYAIGFVGNLFVPKGIDSGEAATLAESLAVNLGLLTLFAVQHSVMARPAFKRGWTRFVPQPVERSTYVMATNVALILLFWLWRPMTTVIWNIEASPVRLLIWGMFWLGWLTVLVSTFLVNHFDLFGLRQVYLFATGRPYTPVGFRTPALHKLVRHPIMLGFIVAFWATPTMTAGHLLFSAVTTAYILVAIQLEERDLVSFHGEDYLIYKRQVRMLIPLPRPNVRNEGS
jgi:protein-S-isoprenylcysteine O-methyltransferase Ste14